MSPVKEKNQQKEIIESGPLLNDKGQLQSIGWARKPIKLFNEDKIHPPLYIPFLNFLRVKKWDFYYIIVPDQLVFGITVADLGYTKNLAFQAYLPENSSLITVDSLINPLSPLNMPAESNQFKGSIKAQSNDINLSIQFTPGEKFVYSTNQANFVIEIPQHKIKGNFTVQQKQSDEEIVMLTPINKDATKFYYNVKSYTMSVNGNIDINGTNYNLEKGLAARDWGRGIWNYNSFWMWMTGQGTIQGGTGTQSFGINLGRGFEDSESAEAYEDSVFINGQIIKLNTVYFEKPKDVKSNWHFYTKSVEDKGSIGGEFSPEIFFQTNVNFLIIKSNLDKFYGTFSGWVIVDSLKTKINFNNIMGFAETHKAKW